MPTRREHLDALDATSVACSPDHPHRSRAPRGWTEHHAAASDHACRLHDRLDGHASALQQRWTDTAREQPARQSHLVVSTRRRAHIPRGTGGTPVEGDDPRLCNATTHGRGCTHPKPQPAGNRPTGTDTPRSHVAGCHR